MCTTIVDLVMPENSSTTAIAFLHTRKLFQKVTKLYGRYMVLTNGSHAKMFYILYHYIVARMHALWNSHVALAIASCNCKVRAYRPRQLDYITDVLASSVHWCLIHYTGLITGYKKARNILLLGWSTVSLPYPSA